MQFQAPVSGRVSSGFGPRLISVGSADHKGIDFAVPTGTPVRASAAGRVEWSTTAGGYGKVVKLDHGSGFETVYAHLSDLRVPRGQFVAAGDIVGLSGATGTVTGPHLHFEIRRNGVAVDPAPLLGLAPAAPPPLVAVAPAPAPPVSGSAVAPVVFHLAPTVPGCPLARLTLAPGGTASHPSLAWLLPSGRESSSWTPSLDDVLRELIALYGSPAVGSAFGRVVS